MTKIHGPQECWVKKAAWSPTRLRAPWVLGILLILGNSINLGCAPGEGTFLSLSTVGAYFPPPSQEIAKHDILEMEHERGLLQGEPHKSPRVIEDRNLEQ